MGKAFVITKAGKPDACIACGFSKKTFSSGAVFTTYLSSGVPSRLFRIAWIVE